MGYFPIGRMLNILFTNYLHEITSIPDIEMIELSTLEWLILLMIVIMIVWVLIVLQARSFRTDEFHLESHADHNGLAGENHGE